MVNTEDVARDLTHRWMEHLGYTPEQIALSDQPRPHNRGGRNIDLGYACEVGDGGWECWDENGESAHPIHDAADEIAEQMVFALQRLADCDLLRATDMQEVHEETPSGYYRTVYVGPWRKA